MSLLVLAMPLHAAADETTAPVTDETAPPGPGTSSNELQDPAADNNEYVNALLQQQEMTRQLREIRNPLLTQEEKDDYVRNVNRAFKSMLSNARASSQKELEILQKGVRHMILRAADPENIESAAGMAELLSEATRDIDRAGTLQSNPAELRRFREAMCREVLECLKLLVENNLETRSFALAVVPHLITEKSPRVIVYEPTYDFLAQLMNSAAQPDSVRSRIAYSMGHILQHADSSPQQQLTFVHVLSSELARRNTSPVYQLVLIDALMRASVSREVVGGPKPTAMIVLVDVLSDKKRNIDVRCHAAAAVGWSGWDNQMNAEPLAWKISQLAVDAGLIFNQNPKNPQWTYCGGDLYLAFHHLKDDETTGRDAKGLLNRAPQSAVVKDAYQQVLKVALPLLSGGPRGQKVPEADLVSVNDWVNANVPANLTWDSSAPPVSR